ncbi:MAG TPA: hypothetical protein VMT89_06340, partial [Candidatus Acidoferrales bacterium]|nr:hypothetical protein [Candidatus Acidoferrales bacterium]
PRRFTDLLARWARTDRNLSPPRGAAALARLGAAVPGGTRVESIELLQTLQRLRLSAASVPALVVGGTQDTVSPVNAVAQFAATLAAQSVAVDAAHPMPWGAGWEKRVSEVHRWIIQQLGEPLLIERGDEDEQ